MVEESSQQVIRIFTQAPMNVFSMMHLIQSVQQIFQNHNEQQNDVIQHGEQTAPQLNQQNKPLKSVTAPKEQLGALRKEFNNYGVDFAIIPREQGAEVLFKAQDIQQISAAWKAVLKTQLPGQQPISELIKHAQAVAADRNAQAPSQAQERKPPVQEAQSL